MNANCFVSLRRHDSHTWVNSLDNISSIVIIFFFIFSINNSAHCNQHLHSSSSRRQVQGIPLGSHIRIMPHYDLHSIPDTNNLFSLVWNMQLLLLLSLFLITTTFKCMTLGTSKRILEIKNRYVSILDTSMKWNSWIMKHAFEETLPNKAIVTNACIF